MSRGAPAIGFSCERRGASSRGIDSSSPSVYGWRGASNSWSAPPVSMNMPGVHDVDALAHARDDAEVVRDHDQRRSLLARRARAAGRGSAPGSSRRARSSARRRSGASACRRAPSRSSPAGACRRRTGAGSPCARSSRSGSRRGRAARRRDASASRFESPKCVWSASRICLPIVRTGFSDVIGSWKMIAISRPRTDRSSRSLIWSRSRPSKCAVPLGDATGARAGSRAAPATVTLLPQPDSPTMPSVSPGAMSNEMPLTAWIVPRRVQNSTRRSRTDSSASTTCHGASGRVPRGGRRRSG